MAGPAKRLQKSPGRLRLPVVLRTEPRLPDLQSSQWHMNLHAYPDPAENKGQCEGQDLSETSGENTCMDCQSALTNPPKVTLCLTPEVPFKA